MKMAEFLEKHGLDFEDNTLEMMLFFTSLDKLYLELTPEQSVELIKDFYNSADDIYNEIKEMAEQSVARLQALFGKDPDEVPEEPKKFDA